MFDKVLKIFQEFGHTKELCLPSVESIFSLILRMFDHECNGQTSVNVAFVMFGPVFIKFRKLKTTHCENKKLDIHKTYIFSLNHPILWGKICFQDVTPNFETSSDWN